MRTLKFRAWDRAAGIWIYGKLDGTDFDCSPNPDFSESDLAGVLLEDMSLEPWLRSTGLKDKNGTSIYEGDIVKADYTKVHVPQSPNAEIAVTVKWNDYCGGFSPFADDPFLGSQYMEIIGNIYENSNLLTV